eukprot:gene16793-biopygen12833
MQDTIQEWHAEDVILEHFGSIFGAFLEPKTTKIASKHAPQRRVYARSVQKGPIDDRAHARKMRFFERLVPESGQGFSSLSLHAMISHFNGDGRRSVGATTHLTVPVTNKCPSGDDCSPISIPPSQTPAPLPHHCPTHGSVGAQARSHNGCLQGASGASARKRAHIINGYGRTEASARKRARTMHPAGQNTCSQECNPESTGNHQKCRASSWLEYAFPEMQPRKHRKSSKNAGNHDGCRPGMACRGGYFRSILDAFLRILDQNNWPKGVFWMIFYAIWTKTTGEKWLERRAAATGIHPLAPKGFHRWQKDAIPDVICPSIPPGVPPALSHCKDKDTVGKSMYGSSNDTGENIQGSQQREQGTCRADRWVRADRGDGPAGGGGAANGDPLTPDQGRIWQPKVFQAKSGLKEAPQRRGYTRSLPMGPIDGTHGCAQKNVFPLSTRASVRAPVR